MSSVHKVTPGIIGQYVRYEQMIKLSFSTE